MKKFISVCFVVFCFAASVFAQIPVKTLVNIVKAEDELRFDNTLEDLLKDKNAEIRFRAAVAAGRIGNEKAVPALVNLLEGDKETNVRQMAAFALGEIESIAAADAILKILNNTKDHPHIRARAIEAAGKIAAANVKDERSKMLGEAILSNLEFERRKRSGPYENVIELGLTAILRARPENAEKTLVEYTEAYTPQIRANALNALARLRAKNAVENARKLLQTDTDAIVRANAARVLGAAEHKESADLLLKAALTDEDSRVRVSAIRVLGSLKDAKSADKLLERGEKIFADYKKSKFANPPEKNELLEIATALGRIVPNTNNEKAVKFLDEFRHLENYESPEIEIAFAQISPTAYLKAVPRSESGTKDFWKQISSTTQAMAEFAKPEIQKLLPENSVKFDQIILSFLTTEKDGELDFESARALPDALRSYSAFKSDDLPNVLLQSLEHKDIFVRAAAAELLGEQTANEQNIKALQTAFSKSLLTDRDYNDAQLAILSALVKLDKNASIGQLATALNHFDHLVRRHAANLIKENDLLKDFPKLGDVEAKVGTVKPYDAKFKSKLGQILNSEADYTRAVSRKNGSVKAVFTTEKGSFTIDLLPEDAPLTVDNFVKLAKSAYFNGVAFHRVVPNFVVQDGDPRGDGNGGPGWSIRDEMNTVPYERGAVGMALSGKNTGGSQWFVTHSPQPHLDGGYTVFGKVNDTDMKIVDNIVRGDKILKVEIVERYNTVTPTKSKK